MRLGFSKATGDILTILDADLTVPPEDLPRFMEVLTSGMGEFVNGVRLVYPMEGRAMRPLNFIGNKFPLILPCRSHGRTPPPHDGQGPLLPLQEILFVPALRLATSNHDKHVGFSLNFPFDGDRSTFGQGSNRRFPDDPRLRMSITKYALDHKSCYAPGQPGKVIPEMSG